jgi:hypothetical protein
MENIFYVKVFFIFLFDKWLNIVRKLDDNDFSWVYLLVRFLTNLKKTLKLSRAFNNKYIK